MSSGNSLDLSIRLQENEQKSKEQELQQFVQLTKKIAQSDRNNDLLRQIKRNKMGEVNRLKAQQREVFEESEVLQGDFQKLADSMKEAKGNNRAKSDYYEELTKKYEELALKERQAEEKSTALSKDNDKLQKKVLSLQSDYDELLKKNKERSAYLQKLKKKKDIQQQLISESERKIQQLQMLCESTKNKAVQLQHSLCKQLEENEGLERTVGEKEKQLELLRRQREQNAKKQEQSKRTTNKLVSKIKSMQDEIDIKIQEIDRLGKVHSRLQKEIGRVEQSQILYEQMVMKRREMVEQLRRDNSKLTKQRQAIKDIKQI